MRSQKVHEVVRAHLCRVLGDFRFGVSFIVYSFFILGSWFLVNGDWFLLIGYCFLSWRGFDLWCRVWTGRVAPVETAAEACRSGLSSTTFSWTISSGTVQTSQTTLAGPVWEGYRESRRCSRDTYPESYITKNSILQRLKDLDREGSAGGDSC